MIECSVRWSSRRKGRPMRCVRACLAGLAFLAFGGGLLAQQESSIRGKLTVAQQRIQQRPSAARWLGLAEMRWAAGESQAALDALRQATVQDSALARSCSDLLCWRAMT